LQTCARVGGGSTGQVGQQTQMLLLLNGGVCRCEWWRVQLLHNNATTTTTATPKLHCCISTGVEQHSQACSTPCITEYIAWLRASLAAGESTGAQLMFLVQPLMFPAQQIPLLTVYPLPPVGMMSDCSSLLADSTAGQLRRCLKMIPSAWRSACAAAGHCAPGGRTHGVDSAPRQKCSSTS